ncbi:MAG: SRPBCC family protein [Myxococcales bacterium]|nr:SRPBCC family protein [Myxococcales bacterium]
MDKLRRIAIWGVLALGALALVATGIGATMEPSHTVTREAVYSQTPQEVWAVITRFDQEASWRSDVEAVQIESGHPIRFVEMNDQGPLPLEVKEQEAPTKMVLVANDPSLPFTGTWTFVLAPVEGGTRLSVTEHGTVNNPLFRFVARVFSDPAATSETYLVDLGRHFGQEVVPQAPAG